MQREYSTAEIKKKHTRIKTLSDKKKIIIHTLNIYVWRTQFVVKAEQLFRGR